MKIEKLVAEVGTLSLNYIKFTSRSYPLNQSNVIDNCSTKGMMNMPKSENQKLKLIYLMKILLDKTDEEHTLTVPEMIKELEKHDISAERKSIYDDIEALRHFGLDIACHKSKTTGYFVASRMFELPELKLLADAVASSKFITEKKSGELIKKIESLSSTYEAKQLHRQVYVLGRTKTMNERIYYNVDTIHQAIAQNKQVSFQYFEYTVDKNKHYRHNGEKYYASPYALSWDDENYYMIAFYEKYDNISHFRVDKMENIEIMEENRRELPDKKIFNLAEYLKKVYNMFGGEEEKIKLQFDNSLIDVVLDRFGKSVTIHKANEQGFIIDVDALISPTLLGWIFGFGDKVKILAPASLIEKLRQKAHESLSQYENEEISNG
jgi:predicted DNA-binding transcriptional regulator YafY